MEVSWDASLLPPELQDMVRRSDLDGITAAFTEPRYTYILFAHCEDVSTHLCARVRGDVPARLATLGRVVPFASYLLPYAEKLLANERYKFNPPESTNDDDLLYLLGLFRLLAFDWRTFKKYIRLDEIVTLLESRSRPVVYLAIRIMQIYLSGADYWFEQMVTRHLGEDAADLIGMWDDRNIDYRFLTLWEEHRFEQVTKLIQEVRTRNLPKASPQRRTIPVEAFDTSTALIGGVLLPSMSPTRATLTTPFDQFAITNTVSQNLESIATSLKTNQALLLKGLPGSGKSSLVRYAAAKLGKLDKIVTLHLNEQSDAKVLIGIHTTGETPGSFVWRPGVLTTAVQEGRWILIEDLDRAPTEIISTLLPLIEKRELLIPNRKQTIFASYEFRILATVRSHVDHRGGETNPLANMLGARHWQNVSVEMPSINEWREIATQLYPSITALLPQLTAVYERVQACRQHVVLSGQGKTGVLRAITPGDFLKWCRRTTKLLPQANSLTDGTIRQIFMEAMDCFVGALPDCPARTDIIAVIAEELRIDPQLRDNLLSAREVSYRLDKGHVIVGQYSLTRANPTKNYGNSKTSFSTNPHTNRMLERAVAAVTNREPLLLVGETGVGKTAAVQHLASQLGKQLLPFNLSQQSEASDLLGGFKPVSARSLIVPMKDEFDELFSAGFSIRKNQQFLEMLRKQFSKGNWKSVCKIWREALKMVEQQREASASRPGEAPSKKRKVEDRIFDFARWDTFAANVSDMERRLASGNEAFAFKFVEGNIVKAVRNGNWVLLDEINLASTDTLESIVDLFDPHSPSLLLAEAGNIERIDAHPDFRVFAAMNPATDVGKKDLPPGIRSRFTELYVESPDKDIQSLQSIVRSCLAPQLSADQAVARYTSELYQEIIKMAEQNMLVDGAGHKPHFSLRTLTRTLSFARRIAAQCSLRRALYEGFQMAFLTFLDVESANLVQPKLEKHLFGKRTNIPAELSRSLRKPDDGHQYLQGYPGSKHWVRQGDFEIEEQPHYILTPFIRTNLENLIRAASTRQFPVLIQGPTSSGKTSMIEYLAKRTGHKFVRINNHEHTDLQEYLGTYVSDVDGRLHFQEGLLVKALREGHWIVLDELNLAPSDVLEALNRLLDDNRELLVPETQEVVRPHENFMLFATQNPAGLYGGRKTLSRAFRNRFLELHFDDIPVSELQEILHRRTQLPESRCKRIVTVYRELSVLRQENRLFEQKSFATLRDLFRWALRPNEMIGDLAANGFMLLAERVRKAEERQTLKDVIQKAMSANGPRVRIDESSLYAPDCSEVTHYDSHSNDNKVVWTNSMRRLYVLVSRAIANNEPVLLVGDTGCGKTTVCQMLAHAFGKELHTVNAHQNTETGDLIGSQRPVRNRAVIEASLRHQLLSTWLLQGLDTAAAYSTDSLLDAYDSAIRSLEVAQRDDYCQSIIHTEVQALRTRYRALFEWSDGALLQAMKTGSFFLLDEISLADDSVLERINSVLEPQRSILLAEKGSLDSYVTALPGFQVFATMNPGGDYGKRELSPALRNRFTEIWVPPLDDLDDFRQIVTAKLVAVAKRYADSMVAFAQWFKDRYNTSASSSISVRDALAWVDFVNVTIMDNAASAVIHGAAMVYIDTLGANPAGLMTMSRTSIDHERNLCLRELSRVMDLDANLVYSALVYIELVDDKLIAGPFSIPRKQPTALYESSFSFQPRTTKINTMRVVKALQLLKPIMLEGNPGVGKTALVVALAQAVGMPLTRINLSDQTDLLDLFGSDVPVQDEEVGTFAWRDAPFLRAMRNGEWVLLDEMNLASQSVLEGLNACIDHRGEVFIPELGQSFSRHPDFRVFAAQNPHHQGGGRKGLPASFVNRFTVVFADAFRSDDLGHICQQSFPQVDPDYVQRAVGFVERLEHDVVNNPRIGANGRPWEFNLRDLHRWLSLVSNQQAFLASGTPRDFVEFLFSQRFRSDSDKAFVRGVFLDCFEDSSHSSDLFPSLSSSAVQLGLALLPRALSFATPSRLAPQGSHPGSNSLLTQSLMLCVQRRWPIILSGSAGVGKNRLIEGLATTVGASVVTITMNAETDVNDLLGGYEQADPQRQLRSLLDVLRLKLESQIRHDPASQHDFHAAQALSALVGADLVAMESSQWTTLAKVLKDLRTREAQAVLRAIERSSESMNKARFEWIDGLLIDAVKAGQWLVLDNANLCSPSVLDRLNSLLEPDGTLVVNEHSSQDGTPQVIRPHPSFRIFLTLDPRYGELSRAMRNRAVELYLPTPTSDGPRMSNAMLQTESTLARYRQTKVLSTTAQQDGKLEYISRIWKDHLGLSDHLLLHRFNREVESGLYSTGAMRLDISHAVSQNIPVELLRRLEDFYRSCIGQLQAPADFINVQTVHPFNNQALVCSSQQPLSTAASLALTFDATIDLAFIAAAVELYESNKPIAAKLSRLERSVGLRHLPSIPQSRRSVVLAIIEKMSNGLVSYLHSQRTVDTGGLSMARKAVGDIVSLCSIFLDYLHRNAMDVACIIAYLSTAKRLMRPYIRDSPSMLSSYVSELQETLTSMTSSLQTNRGRARATLWVNFKPQVPRTLQQFNDLLFLSTGLERFDLLNQRFELPLDAMAGLRVSFLRNLDIARTDEQASSTLGETIQKTFDDSERLEETSNAQQPHFYQVFRRLHEHYAALMLSDIHAPQMELSKLALLAMRPIKEGVDYASTLSPTSAERQFHLLRSSIGGMLEADAESAMSVEMGSGMLNDLATIGRVPLRQLRLLQAEVATLGNTIASQSHFMVMSELHSLDTCLRDLLLKVLYALSTSTDDLTMQGFATQLRTLLDMENIDAAISGATGELSHLSITPGSEERHLFSKLREVIVYLRTEHSDDDNSLHYAAHAWLAFACACLQLYIPEVPFDPALEPQLERSVYQHHHQQIVSQLESLCRLRKALTGQEDSLRARVLQDDLKSLGSGPTLEDIYRPETSQLSELHIDLDSLMRIIQPIWDGQDGKFNEFLADRTSLINLIKVRRRLLDLYRPYHDIVMPVVGFVDCFLTGQRLAMMASTRLQNDAAKMPLATLLPFVDATFHTWQSDDSFVHARSTLTNTAQEILWYGALALRSTIWPIKLCSSALRNAVHAQFHQNYTRWKTNLEEDQRKYAATSSVYRFRGHVEDQEPTQAEVDEYFRTADEHSPSEQGERRALNPSDLAYSISSRHHSTFIPGEADVGNLADLMHQLPGTVQNRPSSRFDENLVPSTIHSVAQVAFKLSEDVSKEQNYSIYSSANVAEAQKLLVIVMKVARHFKHVHSAWPEHATPPDILAICDKLLDSSHLTPVSRLLPGVEKLHSSIHEWQRITSRQYSAADVYEELTSLIVSWRRLELSTWTGLFNREWDQCEKDAASWWYIAYEAIIIPCGATATSREHLQDHARVLAETLGSFLTSSGAGEFGVRLRMLRGFEAHLTVLSIDNPDVDIVRCALANLCMYFAHFESAVSAVLSKGRADLDKEVRNVIQVASWKDRNIDVLKQSAQSSHKKLLRLVRKYRSLLAQPVLPIIHVEFPDTQDAQISVRANRVPLPRDEGTFATDGVVDIPLWLNRPSRFRNVSSTSTLILTKAHKALGQLEGTKQLESFSKGLTNSMKELQRETPTSLTKENGDLVNHLKNLKRRLLADILKDIQRMGFQPSMTYHALDQQRSVFEILACLPSIDHSATGFASASVQYQFSRFISILPKARDAAKRPSTDLTNKEVARCIALLENLLQASISQYKSLVTHLANYASIDRVVDQFRNFAFSESCAANKASLSVDVHASCLHTMVRFCLSTLTKQKGLCGKEYEAIIERLETVCNELAQIRRDVACLPQLPSGLQSTGEATLRTRLANIKQELGSLCKHAVSTHAELRPVISQLTKWIDSEATLALDSSANGYHSIDLTSWIEDMLAVMDTVLKSVQDIESAAKLHSGKLGSNRWLLVQHTMLTTLLERLNVQEVTRVLSGLVSNIQYLEVGRRNIDPSVASICRTLLPILDSYHDAVYQLTDVSLKFSEQLSRTGYNLARAFIELAQQGFCSPSEKSAESSKQDNSMESGTGLGEGEGAEDISKDIGDDEDLSGIADEQENKAPERDLGDEKDAVDMADEEMEGDVADDKSVSERNEAGEEENDQEQAHNVPEEAGDVGTEDQSAIDEKTWDGGVDEDQNQKDGDPGEGRASTNDIRAANEAQDNDTDVDNEAMESEHGVGTEEIQRPSPTKLDEHTEHEQNLELPEDIDMNGKPGSDNDESDIESLDDDPLEQTEDVEPSYTTEDDHLEERPKEDDEVTEAAGDDTRADQNDQNEQDDRTRDDMSDILMQDTQDDDADEGMHDNTSGGTQYGQEDERQTGESHEQQQLKEPQTEEAPEASSEEQNGRSGGGRTDKDDETGNPHGSDEDERTLPLKQLGDALQQWYDQHRTIEQARLPPDEEQGQNISNRDINLADATFEHLPDGDAEEDAQALDVASAEQSTVLHEDNSLPVNDQVDDSTRPRTDTDNNDKALEEDKDLPKQTGQFDAEDGFTQMDQSQVFFGQQQAHDQDTEMADGFSEPEIDTEDTGEEQTILSRDFTDALTHTDARELWSRHEESTRNLATILTEHLRLILQPTKATKLRGDFRTGKRLNIKRIIPYIASSYKRDKIWMRRSVPSKRSYQVMLAIDDSKSMTENQSRDLAFETLALVARSLSMLEVGELSVVSFGADVGVAHDFSAHFTSESGADALRHFTFSQHKTDVRKLLADSIELFRAARLKSSGSGDLWQLQMIISDGICENHSSIRRLLRQANDERIMIVFIVVDSAEKRPLSASEPKQSIMDLQTAEFIESAAGEREVKITKYLDTFPFPYYLIVRDVRELPGVLAGALRQWFAEVVEVE